MSDLGSFMRNIFSLPVFSRAALRVALFCFVGGVGIMPLASVAFAAMAEERLVLVTAAGQRDIAIEVAATPEDMAVGLMFRTALPDGRGMLFPSAAPREASMWMRNTYIPLDMVFIRADGIIHRIEPMTQPLSEDIIASQGEVLAVLELAGGAAAKMGLKSGDRVIHPRFKTGLNGAGAQKP
jgi:uncharacterized protein